MFGPVGWPEILLILVVALLVFGPRRLPELGRTLGRALTEFRRASSDLKRTLNAELALEDDERTRAPRRPELPAPRQTRSGVEAGARSDPDEEPAERVPAGPPPATQARGATPAEPPGSGDREPAASDEPAEDATDPAEPDPSTEPVTH